MKVQSGSSNALAEVAAILAVGFANLRARRTTAAEQARKAREQAQLAPLSGSFELSGFDAAPEPYVVVVAQDTSPAKEAR